MSQFPVPFDDFYGWQEVISFNTQINTPFDDKEMLTHIYTVLLMWKILNHNFL